MSLCRTPVQINTAKARKYSAAMGVEIAGTNAIDAGYKTLNLKGVYQGNNEPKKYDNMDNWLKKIFDEKWEKPLNKHDKNSQYYKEINRTR